MPRVIDVIDHVNVAENELVYREPQQGSGNWRLGSQVIVGESQAAVFVRGGQALDVLGPGRHTLSTANIPVLAEMLNLFTNGRTPFTADLYFVNLRSMPQEHWVTENPMYLRTNTGLGIMLLRARGVMEIKINDPMMFLKKYGMNRPIVRFSDIKQRINTLLAGEINDLLLKSGAQNIVEANGVMGEIEGAMLAKVNQRFAEIGMSIQALESRPLEAVEKSTEELRDFVPLEVWMEVMERQKRLEIGMAAAQNEGMAGSAMGAGMGFSMGQAFSQQFAQQNQQQSNLGMAAAASQQGMQQPQQPQQQQAGGGGGSAPRTKKDIQALIDNLDFKLVNGEISEAVYNRLVQKWQQRLEEMG